MLFISFNVTRNLTSQIFNMDFQSNYGFTLLAVLYITIGLFSLVGSAIVNQLGVKRSLFIGGLGHFFFVFLTTYPAWKGECDADDQRQICGNTTLNNETLIKATLMVSVLFNGFSASILWVAQGEYFSLCVTEETKGFYYGMFWSIYQSSHIFGSLIGAIVL